MLEETISPEELDEIIDGYIKETDVSEENSVPEQAKIAVHNFSDYILNVAGEGQAHEGVGGHE